MTSYNKKTGTTASVLGILLGMGGIFNHGIFEILQGNTSTNGFFIEAIGEANRFWVHGTEAAFTVIHNFLLTGICVILAGSALIFWSLKYMHTKHGATVFLLLWLLLTLVGGGIGHVILFIPAVAFATRIGKPLDWWKKILPAGLRKKISVWWIYSLAATCFAWLTLMELGIFGYFPGQNNPDMILNIVYVCLISSSVMACVTFICAISADIENRNSKL